MHTFNAVPTGQFERFGLRSLQRTSGTPCLHFSSHRHSFSNPFRRRVHCVRAVQDAAPSGDGRETPRRGKENPSKAASYRVSSGAKIESSDIFRDPRVKQLFDQLREARQIIKDEKQRQRALAPFRLSAPRRGIIGNSRYSQKLRRAVSQASRDLSRAPVLIFGEPGLEKTNIGVLIHFGSPYSKAPLVRLDCARFDDDASDLMGRYAKRGLLSWLPPEATIILDNVHKAPPAVLPLLEKAVATASMCASIDSGDDDDGEFLNAKIEDSLEGSWLDPDEGEDEDVLAKARPCSFPRIIMTAEQRVPLLENLCSSVIQVPPLRVRPQDIQDYARYFLRQMTREKGLFPLEFTSEAMRRLEAGLYPNNIVELESAIGRAVTQAAKLDQSLESSENSFSVSEDSEEDRQPKRHGYLQGPARTIGEEVLWMASQPKDRLRVVNLLRTMPGLKDFLRSEWWPNKINFGFTKYAFAAIVAILFIGPQDRDHNFALNAFWCYWWPLSFVAYPFLGRIWCSVCPFMIYGEIVQAWRKSRGAKLLKWPREAMDQWGPWFLFALFAAILVWEEVWDLPQHAALSSWLLLLITFGAMVGSFFFERRIWCRYLCPIGGMNGMFAKLSMTELRARRGVCSAECTTYTCYKGGPAIPPEGMESEGCPVYSHPAQLTDNRNCVLCMECLKACPHGSVEFRLRLPGAGIWSGEQVPLVPEVALLFLLLGALPVHYLPQLLTDVGYHDIGGIMNHKIPHIAVSALVLAIPGLTAWGIDGAWRGLAKLLQPSPIMAMPGVSTSDSAKRSINILNSSTASYAAQMSGSYVVPPAQPFYKLAYGYLPLVWAGTLAYYLPFLFLEGGHILPVAFQTFGIDAPGWVPAFEATQSVSSFLQGGLLLMGGVLSLGLLRRVAAQPWKVIAPQCACMILFTGGLWHLFIH